MADNSTTTFSLVPDYFLPAIGAVMVNHAFMDRQLQTAICILSGIDYSAGVSFLSEIQATSKRAEIFKNLARTKEPDLSQLVKMLVLGDIVVALSKDRNIIAHSLPYWRSDDGSEIGYFKEENKTNPQIAVNPPYRATIASLTELARQMKLAGVWLGMITPNCLPDGIIASGMSYDEVTAALKKHGRRHPFWYDDERFPWLDIYRRKFKLESRKIQNSHRAQKAPPQS